MKKFIIVLLLALAPSLASAEILGCAGGGLFLGGVGSLIGGGVVPKILATFGAGMGCAAGSSIENGTYGKPGPTVTRTVTVVNSGQNNNRHYDRDDSGYRSRPRQAVRGSSYFMEGEGTQYGGNIRPAVYTVTEETVAKPARTVVDPTVYNYTEYAWPVEPKDCNIRDPNYGAAGNCLLRHEKDLALKQKACNGETKMESCPTGYNAGIWAGIYHRVGQALVLRQAEESGGGEAFK